jgi:hypothetical protein
MAPWEMGTRNSLKAIKFEDSAFGIGFIQGGLAFGKADEQAIEADAIELAGNSIAELMSSADKSVRERATLDANGTQVMFDVDGRLGQVEGLDVVADLDALVEGFEALEMEGCEYSTGDDTVLIVYADTFVFVNRKGIHLLIEKGPPRAVVSAEAWE